VFRTQALLGPLCEQPTFTKFFPQWPLFISFFPPQSTSSQNLSRAPLRGDICRQLLRRWREEQGQGKGEGKCEREGVMEMREMKERWQQEVRWGGREGGGERERESRMSLFSQLGRLILSN
jgi:hypothetical protein